MLRTAFVTASILVVMLSEITRTQDVEVYRPKLATPEVVEPFLKYLEPGSDAFTSEREAKELDARLRELGRAMRAGPAKAAGAIGSLLAPNFRGGRPAGDDDTSITAGGSLDVRRTKTQLPATPAPHGTGTDGAEAATAERNLPLDARAFTAEMRRVLEDLRLVLVAEFLITSIDIDSAASLARTDVRYDIVGVGAKAWRLQHVGLWRLTWRRGPSGWQVAEWSIRSRVTSRAASPVFTETTETTLGRNESFKRQLGTGLDAWMATIDSVLARDSNGHHGVSIGDADGDGLDDLYIAQPAGLPNRLFRARGDSTFEDITERAGLGVLDDTAQSLFADVDNDGDQDLVLSTGTRPLLFVNDGKGRFANVPDAFQFTRPLQGVLTSIAMSDYDRDGFLDLYLCVYSYFFGAGEDKAGTPAPYYDARNGPPGVLFRNDGHGRFIDATRESGLDEGNDRYHFAAAWADYDGDGWQDLLVANDFGTKNLYRNRGAAGGRVTFEDVAAAAGVLDHGAGMSAAFFDYDNDGRLDIYTGNIWSDSGLRVTSASTFMPDVPADVRALYRRHARGNSLFRNLGDGRFEDESLEARAEMGRWAWSCDTLDFDSDGWEDLYIANGMLTRETGRHDLDGFFWRQVVARSPLTRVRDTPYDDGWRAMNQMLIGESIASQQRNVFLRNDGRGGFDDVSGAVGLDLDQDGRSFGVLDIDRDGDPDLVVMAARQAPQVRVFRNDFARQGASLAIRLTGRASNRDAIGAQVSVETDTLRRTKVVHAGSGFLSQYSKELIVGLGPSTRIQKLTVAWPSGKTQVFTDVPLNVRLRLVEGADLEKEAFAPAPAPAAPDVPAAATLTKTLTKIDVAPPPASTWLHEPFPAPDFSAPDARPSAGSEARSLAALRGRPALLLFWSVEAAASRAALDALARGSDALAKGGVAALALALDPPAALARVQAAAKGVAVPVVASENVALSYAIAHRHIFMNRQDPRVPTAFLVDQAGRIVKVYRDRLDVAEVLRDASRIEAPDAERLARAMPFPGTLYSAPPARNFLFYGRELLDQGLDAAAIAAFERAVQASPNASTLYRLGTLLQKGGDVGRARAAFERALALQPDLAEANNDLGTLLAQSGDLDGAIARFRAALATASDYPDALNNLGYAMLLTGQDADARGLYEKALALQPDFPEALNNLGLLLGRAGELAGAERYFRDAVARRAEYGEAANNLALVLVARGDGDGAIRLLEEFLTRVPKFESAYITLAKIHFNANRPNEGLAVLNRLLQHNPTHPVALELVRQFRPR
jgi:Tfp pilus assembly protein PilF/peroxiredoxin